MTARDRGTPFVVLISVPVNPLLAGPWFVHR
jgi:hypothetical protein